ncbi:MAG: hypothetical protein Q7S22_01040 [Candidatus Micrarchaeota archaeon]|nr:hypothetical protein [Candidatus Micrarchaeota archaeon]
MQPQQHVTRVGTSKVGRTHLALVRPDSEGIKYLSRSSVSLSALKRLSGANDGERLRSLLTQYPLVEGVSPVLVGIHRQEPDRYFAEVVVESNDTGARWMVSFAIVPHGANCRDDACHRPPSNAQGHFAIDLLDMQRITEQDVLPNRSVDEWKHAPPSTVMVCKGLLV